VGEWEDFNRLKLTEGGNSQVKLTVNPEFMQRDIQSSSLKNVWKGGGSRLKPGEELEFDSDAYKLLHRTSVDWFCLSIDVFREPEAPTPPTQCKQSQTASLETVSTGSKYKSRPTSLQCKAVMTLRTATTMRKWSLSWNTSASVIAGLLAECVCGKTRTKSLLGLSQAQSRSSTFQDN
jgi:hypothetical protein